MLLHYCRLEGSMICPFKDVPQFWKVTHQHGRSAMAYRMRRYVTSPFSICFHAVHSTEKHLRENVVQDTCNFVRAPHHALSPSAAVCAALDSL